MPDDSRSAASQRVLDGRRRRPSACRGTGALPPLRASQPAAAASRCRTLPRRGAAGAALHGSPTASGRRACGRRAVVTAGLSHGIGPMVADDLFARRGEGGGAVSEPVLGNYRQAFALRTGAKVLTAPAYVDGRYNPRAHSPMPWPACRRGARRRDAEHPLEPRRLYAGPARSAGHRRSRCSPRPGAGRWWSSATTPTRVWSSSRRSPASRCSGTSPGRIPNLLAVKVDGATKELSFFGGRARLPHLRRRAGVGGGAGARERG